MKYEVLQHIGDAKIKVFGKTKEQLFLNALRGMSAVLNPKFARQSAAGPPRAENPKQRSIKVKSQDINALLVDFLNEVNYLRTVNMEMYDNVKFTKFSDVALEGELKGYGVEEFGEDIKAVTFHGLDICKNPNGEWETVIVFDI